MSVIVILEYGYCVLFIKLNFNTRERELTEIFFRIDLTKSLPRYQTLNLISISLPEN